MSDNPLQNVLPVLDIKLGQVVTAVAGMRDHYQPIRSPLVQQSEPDIVARAFQRRFGFHSFYLADLDSLSGAPVQWAVLHRLVAAGFALFVDANWWDENNRNQLTELISLGNNRPDITPIFSSEGMEAWTPAVELLKSQGKFWFSLDLKQGELVGPGDHEKTAALVPSVLSKIEQLVECAPEALVLLDVAGVGTFSGPVHLDLVRTIKSRFPALTLISGGGVRTETDIAEFVDAGCQQVLVSRALHEERLSCT